MWVASRKKVPNGLSRCHTKRKRRFLNVFCLEKSVSYQKKDGRSHARSSFFCSDLFAWMPPMYVKICPTPLWHIIIFFWGMAMDEKMGMKTSSGAFTSTNLRTKVFFHLLFFLNFMDRFWPYLGYFAALWYTYNKWKCQSNIILSQIEGTYSCTQILYLLEDWVCFNLYISVMLSRKSRKAPQVSVDRLFRNPTD